MNFIHRKPHDQVLIINIYNLKTTKKFLSFNLILQHYCNIKRIMVRYSVKLNLVLRDIVSLSETYCFFCTLKISNNMYW